MGDRTPKPPTMRWIVRDEEYLLDGEESVWRQAEEWIIERNGWREEHESTHDALTDDGEKVEIKSCVWRQRNGQTGRLTIWGNQYFEADLLALVVYTPVDDDASVIAHGVVDMRQVEFEIHYRQHDTMGACVSYLDPEWPELLTLKNVVPLLRHTFAEVLDNDEGVVVLIDPCPRQVETL